MKAVVEDCKKSPQLCVQTLGCRRRYLPAIRSSGKGGTVNPLAVMLLLETWTGGLDECLLKRLHFLAMSCSHWATGTVSKCL